MSTIPVLSIMGWSGSGKTTLIEKLIPLLKARGLRVGVLKHDGHRFDMDREGKDTWRFGQAGADVVAISSADRSAVLEYRRLELNDMLARFHDLDLILVEGYKASDLPRIEVHRLASGKPMFENPENLAALVTDAHALVTEEPLKTSTAVFDINNAEGIASFIVRNLSLIP